MEKNGLLTLKITEEELALFSQESIISQSMRDQGVISWSQMDDIIQLGEYEVVPLK